MIGLLGSAAHADTLRIATFHTELLRDGPGLLLRDIQRGEDAQVQAVINVIAHNNPDIIVLQSIDYDLNNSALNALADGVGMQGVDYPHRFALQPNNGLTTGLDMNGDGRLGDPEDAQGYGSFAGQGGIAMLSKYPIDVGGIRDFTDLLWVDLPDAITPGFDGEPFPSRQALDAQRLSTTNHWDVPVTLPNEQTVRILGFHATPPVFDGPEDRNGRRNHDEIVFWKAYLDGLFGEAPEEQFVIAGVSNLDPVDGDGRREAIVSLLSDRRLIDPEPRSEGGAAMPGGDHMGDPAFDTADFPEDGPGNLRTDILLPSADWEIEDAGVFWPTVSDPDRALLGSDGNAAGRHRLVWVDLVF